MYVMISPTANESAAAECIVWVRVWAYGCTKTSQRCAFEGGAGRHGEIARGVGGVVTWQVERDLAVLLEGLARRERGSW